MEDPELQSRMSYIVHKGEKILHIDHTRLVGMPEMGRAREFFDTVREEIDSQPEGSVRVLTSMSSNLRFNTELAALYREHTVENSPYIKRSAVVGATPILKAIIASFRFITGRDIRTFDTTEEALDWLAE